MRLSHTLATSYSHNSIAAEVRAYDDAALASNLALDGEFTVPPLLFRAALDYVEYRTVHVATHTEQTPL